MIPILRFDILFLKYRSGHINFSYWPTRSSGLDKKDVKKNKSQIRSKNLIYLMNLNLNLSGNENNMLP